MSALEDLFHPVVELPEEVRAERYRRLIGLDDIKDELRREAALLADPSRLEAWAKEHHGDNLAALALFRDRAPLFVFAGDVGAGKTALAESFGCEIADTLDVPVYLYRLKLTARGSGLVGEMTTLIGDAFALILAEGRKARGTHGPKSAFVVVVDEADALTQSRAAEQMHHEDRAGVDALLAGVDSLAGEALPVIVVMCTNRVQAMDPAVTRRAAAIFTFDRPNDDQRRDVLRAALTGTKIDGHTIDQLVAATGPHNSEPGFTYSDLTQRLIARSIMTAFPDRPLTGDLLLDVASRMKATPEFSSPGS
jgi:AAA+ superfamily predicted ATPase